MRDAVEARPAATLGARVGLDDRNPMPLEEGAERRPGRNRREEKRDDVL